MSDCAKVTNLALDLNLNLSNPSLFSEIQQDCCRMPSDPNGSILACSGNTVFAINWNNRGLSGSINASNIPSSLQKLYLQNNKINGSMPVSFPDTMVNLHLGNNPFSVSNAPLLPPRLKTLDLSTCNLVGSIQSFPRNLTYIDLSYNQPNISSIGSILNPELETLRIKFCNLSGHLPNLTRSLKGIDLSSNDLEGPVPSLPPNLISLYLGFNHFTGFMPTLPNGLINLYINANLLVGEFPVVPISLTTLQIGHFGDPLNQRNKFNGSLQLEAPVKLQINFNLFSNISVTNASLLSTSNCDISNNPFENTQSVLALMQVCKNSGFEMTSLAEISLKSTWTSSGSSFDLNSDTAIVIFATETLAPVEIKQPIPDMVTYLVIALLAGILLIFVFLLFVKKYLKDPKIHSKFARKKSDGTLITYVSNKSNK